MNRELFPFRRFRVIWREEGSRRSRTAVTLGGKEPVRRTLLGVPVLSFSDERAGNIHIIASSLVERVVIEQEDRYGDWHETGEWPIGSRS